MIKYVDLGVSEAEFDSEIVQLLRPIFLGGSFVGGAQIGDFEINFANYCEVDYALSLNSGTDALILALRALEIGSGDEVITVANSFIATANSIVMVGAKPVFVDVNDDLLIDPSKIEAAITPKTKAIMPVHLTGLACDMDEINAIAKRNGLYVIEDAAQSAGSLYKGKKTGSLGDIGCFSLHPLKNLGGVGDGGIITVNDRNLADKIKTLRNHGLKNRDEQECVSGVSRLDTINAAILNYRLASVDRIVSDRRAKASLYDELLCDIRFVKTPIAYNDRLHSYHVYVIRADKRDLLMDYLLQNGVETKIHYPLAITQQKPYIDSKILESTQKLSKQILTLPIANVTDDEIKTITSLIKGFFK